MFPEETSVVSPLSQRWQEASGHASSWGHQQPRGPLLSPGENRGSRTSPLLIDEAAMEANLSQDQRHESEKHSCRRPGLKTKGKEKRQLPAVITEVVSGPSCWWAGITALPDAEKGGDLVHGAHERPARGHLCPLRGNLSRSIDQPNIKHRRDQNSQEGKHNSAQVLTVFIPGDWRAGECHTPQTGHKEPRKKGT